MYPIPNFFYILVKKKLEKKLLISSSSNSYLLHLRDLVNYLFMLFNTYFRNQIALRTT